MKVLMLGWELPPNNSGGLGVACYQLCKALAKRGADIDFIVPYTAKHHDIEFMNVVSAVPQDVSEIMKSGIAYDSYKYIFHDGHEEWVGIYGQQLAFEKAVGRMVRERDFDVIHAHDWLTFRAALRAKQYRNKPLIAHVHSIERDRAGGAYGNPLVREIEYMTLMLADRVIAVSNHTKRMIINEYDIPADKIDVVHNSIDIGDLEPLDDRNVYQYLAFMKRRGYRVVANVGRLTVQKGLPNLLQAARHVIDAHPKTFFLFVGTGEQYTELIEQAAALGIADKVFFTGFQRGKNWRDAYSIADLFVMPSVSEPFGLTPLEAISYGTPTLISKQSGVAEVLTNCLKVDYWDVHEMANQITAVVRNDSLRDELHKNSYREFEQMNWSGAADQLFDLYHRQSVGVAA